MIQSFGFHNKTFADSIAAPMGYDGDHYLLILPDDIALVAEPRRTPQLVQRSDCRSDPWLVALGGKNPLP